MSVLAATAATATAINLFCLVLGSTTVNGMLDWNSKFCCCLLRYITYSMYQV